FRISSLDRVIGKKRPRPGRAEGAGSRISDQSVPPSARGFRAALFVPSGAPPLKPSPSRRAARSNNLRRAVRPQVRPQAARPRRRRHPASREAYAQSTRAAPPPCRLSVRPRSSCTSVALDQREHILNDGLGRRIVTGPIVIEDKAQDRSSIREGLRLRIN